MSKFNFHQAITELNKNGYVLINLEQKPQRDGTYIWYCSIANEENHVLTTSGAMMLTVVNEAVASMHVKILGEPVEDDCDLV